jgi:hypothetical protein
MKSLLFAYHAARRDANGAIQPGGASNGKGVSIPADDRGGGAGGAAPVVSGPGKIEIWKGDPSAGGQLLASNDDDFPDQHTYTKDDPGLSILDQLPEGQIFVKVFDRADAPNETSVIGRCGFAQA